MAGGGGPPAVRRSFSLRSNVLCDPAGFCNPMRLSVRMFVLLQSLLCIIVLALERNLRWQQSVLLALDKGSGGSATNLSLALDCQAQTNREGVEVLRSEVRMLNHTGGDLFTQLDMAQRGCDEKLLMTRGAMVSEMANLTKQIAKCRKYVASKVPPAQLPPLPINNHYQNYAIPTYVDYKDKPRVAIILGFDTYAATYYAKQILSLSCYAALHDIPIHYEHFPLHNDRVPNRGRLRAYLKYMAYYQWIVSFDADTKVNDYSRSFLEYLDDAYDIILMERGMEVTSSHVAFRSTGFSVQFIKEWMDFALPRIHRKNTDNGDLLDLLLSRYFRDADPPDRGFKIGDWNWPKYAEYKQFFHDKFFSKDLGDYWPIKIYRHHEGFMNHEAGTGIFSHIKETKLTEDELYCRPSLLHKKR